MNTVILKIDFAINQLISSGNYSKINSVNKLFTLRTKVLMKQKLNKEMKTLLSWVENNIKEI